MCGKIDKFVSSRARFGVNHCRHVIESRKALRSPGSKNKNVSDKTTSGSRWSKNATRPTAWVGQAVPLSGLLELVEGLEIKTVVQQK